MIRSNKARIITIALALVAMLSIRNVYGQAAYPFMTHEVDSICGHALRLIRIKNSLVWQQQSNDIRKDRIENDIANLNNQKEELAEEKQLIDHELDFINKQLDSLIYVRPQRPRPKANLMDLIEEGLTIRGNYGLNINQLALSNWAAGGESSSTGKAFADIEITYQRATFEQRIVGSFVYGLSRFADKRIEKQDDKIDLRYTLSLHSKQKLKYSIVSTFNTQFANGYKYPNDTTMISGFFAPAYLTLSSGVNYKDLNHAFEVYASPLAGKMTFVLNQDLADQGAFGVKKGYYTADSVWIPGQRTLPALGANIIINYKQPIGKTITYSTILNCFYNYFEQRNDKRLKLDVNWENTINFIITKHVTTVLFLHLKYDHNTTFPIYEELDGVQTLVGEEMRIQFKESLGIAFIHKF